MPSDAHYWNAVHAEWSATGRDAAWRAYADELDADWINAWLPSGPRLRVLKTDLFNEAVGAGVIPSMRESRDAIFGIDVSSGVARSARDRTRRLVATTADVRALPYGGGTFDVVVSNSTLDHFEAVGDIEVAIAEVMRVLRPTGSLLISMDNHGHPALALRRVLPSRWLRPVVPYAVGASVTRRGLRRLLMQAGFEVEEMRSVLHVPRVAAVPTMRWVERHGHSALQQRIASIFRRFELLGAWPTASVTGHFVVALARKPG